MNCSESNVSARVFSILLQMRNKMPQLPTEMPEDCALVSHGQLARRMIKARELVSDDMRETYHG